MNRNYNALILKSVKITAGAILAILFASCLNLKYSATAGIITILSIQNTKKRKPYRLLLQEAKPFAVHC